MDREKDHVGLEADGLRKHTLVLQATEFYKAKRYQEALAVYEEAIQLDPNYAEAYVGKGNCLRQLGSHRLAFLTYEQCLTIYPDNVSAHIGSSYALLELGKYDRASMAYRKAIRLDPNNASAHNVAGQVLCSQARFGEALQAFEAAISLATEDNNVAGYYNNKGIALLELKRCQEALDAFVQALQLDRDKSKYQNNLLKISKYERFKKANHYCDSAEMVASQNRHEEALQMLDKALQIDSDHIRADIGKGNVLLYCHSYELALLTFDKHLHIYPRRIQALLGKGKALYELKRYDDALTIFQRVLLFDDQLAQAYVSMGNTHLALNKTIEALKCYGEAMDLRTDDITCYINVGYILFDLQFYEKVIHTYEKAFQCIPNLVAIYPRLKNPLSKLALYWPYLAACREVLRQGTSAIAIYLSISDTLTAFGLHEDAIEAHEKALVLALAKSKQDSDQLWSLLWHSQTSTRPAHIRFELLKQYILNTPAEYQSKDTFERISNLYLELFEISYTSTEIFRNNLQLLHSILLHIAEEERAKVITLIAGNDDVRIAQLLIYLASFSLPGLEALAHRVTADWVVAPRDDDLVIRFYHVLDSYSVPFETSDWLFAQELMIEGLYIQAKSVLSDLVEQHSTSESLWLLATAMWYQHSPAQKQIAILHQFIASVASSDTRCGEAWKRIGELLLENNEGEAAIAAFHEAERYDDSIPQLKLYRTGNWDAFPALHLHPDFAFPTVVVIDLECDYQPDAADGLCVFEIAAVRRKGRTELATCNLIIRRDFPSKVIHPQNEPVEPEKAAHALQEFIGSAIVVGHNLQGFDVKHLRGMDVEVDNEQIIDTLAFARLLYPDSVHHHLALLCTAHGISPQGEWHTALADAGASADLLHALGEDLVRRGGQLLAGFRAFVPPGSAFDRAVLQPRGIGADSAPCPEFDPSPTTPHILTSAPQESASPSMLAAFERNIDALVERYDPCGAYIQYLPLHKRIVVVMNSRTRLERMLVLSRDKLDPFVLPDPHTLLCPQRLRQSIEGAQSWQMKLALFCLYQASHNHDARTLYPLRISSDDPSLNELKHTLLKSCCASDWQHLDTCPATLAVQLAAENHNVLLATHESFLRQPSQPRADLMIVDDADNLQMHFAEYLAERVTSEQVRSWSPQVFGLIDTQIARYVKENLTNPDLFERISLKHFVPYLAQPPNVGGRSPLSVLQSTGYIGAKVAATLEKLCQQALEEVAPSNELHASWLELRMAPQTDDKIWSSDWRCEQWSFCGVDQNLPRAFREIFWRPYQRHLICGTAITLGTSKTIFLTRFFGLPENIAFLADRRPASQIHIPSAVEMRPASFLGRRPWARGVGNYLYGIAATSNQSVLVSLQTPPVANALIQVFKNQQSVTSHQVLSPQLGWTTTKIADRLADETRLTLTFVSPRLREAVLDGPVDIEATGPLRFLHQQDPLVAAHLRLYAKLYPDENPFSSYLLPQALLELKTRISSLAKIHIILDSGLHSKVYRDEVCSLFQQDALLESLPEISGEKRTVPEAFTITLDIALERWGLSSRTSVDNETLHLALRTYWGTDRFRAAPLNQKEIVQAIFEGSDQLVIAATGGGKSLCFQLPAILMAQEIVPKVTLVISPLIALMQDQVEALKDKGIFSAIAWNSTLEPAARKNYIEGIKRGWYSIIYIAPEQIHSASLRNALAMRDVGLIAIDEAHCVSQWGHDFRTAYSALKRWIETQICDGQKRIFPIIALTATARKGYRDSTTGAIEQGTVEEIIENLGLRLNGAQLKIPSIERSELEYGVEQITLPCLHCRYPLPMVVGQVKCPLCGRWCQVEEEQIKQTKVDRLISLLAERGVQGLRQRWDGTYGQRQRGLIYCAYTKTTEEVAEILRTDPRLEGLRVKAYHRKKYDKQHIYNSFIRDDKDGLDIVVATNAFGMGIDVRRLGFVIHFDIPGTLEAYIQEAGRAGRDTKFKQAGEAARCILLYHEHDLEKPRGLSEMNSIDEQDIVSVHGALRKFRNHKEKEAFVTQNDLGLMAGLNEGRVGSVLFYLEHHTRFNWKPLLERGEYVQTEWLLAFEHGYERRIQVSVPNALSRQLIYSAFRNSDEYRLREREIRVIDGDDLAESLGWETEALLGEIRNLLARHVIVRANQFLIQWSKSKDEADQLITQLEQGVGNLLRNIPDQRALHNGKRVAVDLESLHNEGTLATTPLSSFIGFLDGLSKSTAVSLRLFEYFEHPYAGHYYLQLATNQEATSTPENIFQQLREIIRRFAPTKLSDSDPWQVVDMLIEEKNYEQRALLEQGFLLLANLELLLLHSPEHQKSPMRIRFRQDDVPGDQLDVDLSRLRLVKKQNEHKLELMKMYTTMPSEQRTRMLNAYFGGEMPLLEPFEMRQNLTEQQQALVATSEGYHLVSGPAGSGKTTVLEEHVRYLVEYLLVPPDHVLVVTHYNGAVDRISKNASVYQGNGKTISATTLNKLGVSIFLQNRELLLRPDGRPYYAEKVGLRLLKSEHEERLFALRVLSEMREELNLSPSQEATLQEKQYAFWVRPHSNTIDNCLKDIARLRQHGIFPTHTLDTTALSYALGKRDNQNWIFFVYDVYCRHVLLLSESGGYTYDDQVLLALALLKANPEIAQPMQRRYEHIIIDEFQDLTPAQLELIGILSQKHHSVMAFGDDAQDIRVKQESSRTPSLLEKRLHRISGNTSPEVHHLQTNFRSVQEILDVAGTIRNDVPQTAARGYRKRNPAVILVNFNTPSPSGDRDVYSMLQAMVKEALVHMKKLPEVDGGSVALMVAISGWSQIVQDYLKREREPFSVLDHSRYQARHIGRILTYFRLIVDDQLDTILDELLRYCITSGLSYQQLDHLKEEAQKNEEALINALKDSELLKQINVSQEQEETLRQHLDLIYSFSPESRFADVWEAISKLQDSPLAKETIEMQEQEELESVLDEFRNTSVIQAVEHINSHFTFLEEHRTNQKLIVTSIDSAKSQAFDTVFLLGAQALKINYANHRARLYVSVSRARQRFFFLVDERSDEVQGDGALLPWLHRELNNRLAWL